MTVSIEMPECQYAYLQIERANGAKGKRDGWVEAIEELMIETDVL